MIGPCASCLQGELGESEDDAVRQLGPRGNPRSVEPVIPRDDEKNVFLSGESAGSSFSCSVIVVFTSRSFIEKPRAAAALHSTSPGEVR